MTDVVDAVSGGKITGQDLTTGAEINPPEKTEIETPDTETEKEETDKETPDKVEKVESEEPTGFEARFDPKKLPKELQPVYKQMQADYTRKTQEIAAVRKAADAYHQFRPYLQRVMNDPELMDVVFKGKKIGQIPAPTLAEETIPDDPKQYAEWVKGKTIAEVRQMMDERDRQFQTRQVMERDYSEAELVDERLSKDPEFSKIILGYISQDATFRQGGKTAVQATKDAIDQYETFISKITGKAKEDLVNRARSKSNIVTRPTSPSGTSQGSKAAMNIRDAWKQAEEELASK